MTDPRRTTFTGTVQAAGLWFTTPDARKRVLAEWRPGSQVHRVDNGLLLIWPSPRFVRASTASGAPVVRYGAALSTAPLRDVPLASRAFVVVKGGQCVVTPLTAETIEHPSTWIDLTGVSLVVTTAPTPPPPVTFVEPPKAIFTLDPIDAPVTLSLRQRLRALYSWLTARSYSRYFADLLHSFETGDLDRALRHAIPLAGVQESLLQPSRFPVPPKPRADLSIRFDRSRVTQSVGFEARLLERLRQHYRDAFDRLSARGRVEEAAFVLTELLQCHEEAVAYLERHGKLEKAAQLAEARGLNPGLVIRQWFIAGNHRRAILIARRTGAFAEAVALLDSPELRQAWAEHLAEAGNYAAAVEAVWPVPSLRSIAEPWLDRAISVGGSAGAAALAWKASVQPEAFPTVLKRLLDLPGEERWAFARALRQDTSTPQTRTLMRPVIRSLCRDVASGVVAVLPGDLRAIIDFANDANLRADLPGVPAIPPTPADPSSYRVEASDVGLTPLHHAFMTSSGHILAAAGEGGCLLIDRNGRTVARFALPAEKLVPADHGTRAITLARRGDVWKIGRIDLLDRREMSWCESKLDSFAPSYDGSHWFVGIGGSLHAIDATAASLESIWHVPDAGQRIASIFRDARRLRAVVDASGDSSEEWIFELPNLTLRHRTAPVSAEPQLDNPSFILKGATRIATAVRENHLVICDERGRLLAIDLITRRLLRNLRV